MFLQGPEARSALAMEAIDATVPILPEALHWLQRRAVGGQLHPHHMCWDFHALRHLRWRVVEEADLATLRLGLAPLPPQTRAAVRSQAGPRPPAGRPRGGLPRGIAPVRLLQGCDPRDRLHPRARQPPLHGPVQAQAPCILTKAPYRLVRRWSSYGGHGAEAPRALFAPGGARRRVFFAGRGRGRLRLAWS
jgi:hypothetical protein